MFQKIVDASDHITTGWSWGNAWSIILWLKAFLLSVFNKFCRWGKHQQTNSGPPRIKPLSLSRKPLTFYCQNNLIWKAICSHFLKLSIFLIIEQIMVKIFWKSYKISSYFLKSFNFPIFLVFLFTQIISDSLFLWNIDFNRKTFH